MKQAVRILNEIGIQRFRVWLQGGGDGAPPSDLLLDPSTSEALPGSGAVEQRGFDSRYEMAVHVLDALGTCDFNRIGYSAGLWAWLSLFYVELICPLDRHGRRSVLELPRYLLTPEHRNYYRHLIREPVILVRKNGEFARALLTSRAGRFRISSVFEEVASRQELISNPGVVELVWRLYFHPKRHTVRVGVAGHGRSGGIRRFGLVLQQLGLNYDLPAMNARQIADLLPKEFEPWKRRANWELVAAPDRGRAPARCVRFDGIPVGSQWRRSHLAELWGYGDARSLRGEWLMPRGQDFLILLATGGDEPTFAPGGGGAFHWGAALPRSAARRLADVSRRDKPVHIFRRAQARGAFVYLGKARVEDVKKAGDGPGVQFSLLPAL